MKITRFYVTHTRLDATPETTELLEIQMLDDDGRAVASVMFPASEIRIFIGDYQVPISVIQAAAGIPIGSSRFVDINGIPIEPF